MFAVEETHQQGSCPTPGCSGVGHIKGAKYVGHHRSVVLLATLQLDIRN